MSACNQSIFGIFTGNILVAQIDQHQVVVRTTGNAIVTAFEQCTGQCLRIRANLLAILFKRWLHGFTKCNSLGGNDMFEWASLYSGEYAAIENGSTF